MQATVDRVALRRESFLVVARVYDALVLRTGEPRASGSAAWAALTDYLPRALEGRADAAPPRADTGTARLVWPMSTAPRRVTQFRQPSRAIARPALRGAATSRSCRTRRVPHGS